MGLDATNKMAGETEREWGSTITMSDEVKARIDSLWQDLGIEPKPQELNSLTVFFSIGSPTTDLQCFIIPASRIHWLPFPRVASAFTQFTESAAIGLIRLAS